MATLPLSGMNNRLSEYALPPDKSRLAVNVMFDDANKLILPRWGSVIRYAGDIKWLFHKPGFVPIFVEGGDLKQLNDDDTATALHSGVGDNRMSYTVVGNTIYYSNGLVKGKIRNGVVSEWGTDRPTRQPDCTAIDSGGMFGGDYRVALTWIADEESGTGMGRRVTVAEGGGIKVDNFTTAPSYATGLAIYVSSVNSTDMYLYAEYPVTTTEVWINRLTPEGVIPTIPLETQFGFPPMPIDLIVAHYGRIYYPRGRKLYFTMPRRYGCQKANSSWLFDSDIQTCVSTPGVLYIGTQHFIYKVSNIDGDGPPIRETLQNCGTVNGSECYDPDGISAYFMSDRGFIKATPEGLVELSYNTVAIPFFEKGTATVMEQDGVKYLVFVGQDGIQNPLADKVHNAAELVRGSL